MKLRSFWVLIHRYTGLAMTVFLVIVGLTGSLLAFYTELEGIINPQLMVAEDSRQMLDFPALVAQAERLAPEAQVDSIWPIEGSASVQVGVSPKTDPSTHKPYDLAYDQLVLNTYTGEELGRRTWGSISQGKINLMAFIYKLHYALALDEIGTWILGITALIWTLDCFVGFYLTLPTRTKANPQTRQRQEGQGTRGFWLRWLPAWQIKWSASVYRINFDLHRAGGLWMWLMLLIFAWSSVYMNLSDSVYKTVMKAVSEYHEPWVDIDDLSQPLANPAINFDTAYRIANQTLAASASDRGVKINRMTGMWLNREKGFYALISHSSADIQDRYGHTRAVIDANTGQTLMVLFPSGQYGGNSVTTWLQALHMANVFGMPYRIFVCVFGWVIIMLCVTGVVIWNRKRRAVTHRKTITATTSSAVNSPGEFARVARKENSS